MEMESGSCIEFLKLTTARELPVGPTYTTEGEKVYTISFPVGILSSKSTKTLHTVQVGRECSIYKYEVSSSDEEETVPSCHEKGLPHNYLIGEALPARRESSLEMDADLVVVVEGMVSGSCGSPYITSLAHKTAPGKGVAMHQYSFNEMSKVYRKKVYGAIVTTLPSPISPPPWQAAPQIGAIDEDTRKGGDFSSSKAQDIIVAASDEGREPSWSAKRPRSQPPRLLLDSESALTQPNHRGGNKRVKITSKSSSVESGSNDSS